MSALSFTCGASFPAPQELHAWHLIGFNIWNTPAVILNTMFFIFLMEVACKTKLLKRPLLK